MPEFLRRLFSSDGLLPHGHCYMWQPGLIWLHVISDGLTALAYTTIPFTLLQFVRRRKDLPFNWMFLCFGVFIVACGATHYMEIWTLWTPTYWLSGVVKAITAAASVPTAILLVRLLPKALAIPTPGQLVEAHEDLRRAHEALEVRVRERTAELVEKNEELAREIAERKRSDARFRRLAESGVVGVFLSEIGGPVHEANDAFLAMVGYDRDDLRDGKIRPSEMSPPGWGPTDEAARAQLRSVGIVRPWEKELFRKDGTRVPILIAIAMLDEKNCVAVVVDRSETKRAAESIRQLREERAADARFRALLESAPDAMVIVGGDGKIVLVNERAETLFGYGRKELLDQPVERLVPERFRGTHSAHRAQYASAPLARPMGGGRELWGLRKDGSEFPVEISLSPIETDEGALVSSAIRDISERRRVEASLKQANRELEAFSYSVAHDLRSPLRAISGFAQVLLDDYNDRLDEEGQKWLCSILGNAQRMAALIDALLLLSRLSRTELKIERVDLGALARGALSRLAEVDPERAVELVVQAPLWADIDPHLARTLTDNLVENAWKFTSKAPQARIEVGAADTTHGPAFFVRDNGAGFDMAFADKLFNPFQRLHPASEYPGTGVGLATVHRVVERHGGKIWAEGATGQGATFYFTLSGAKPVTPSLVPASLPS
ncbi:MAG TPA: PAS domain S-box protein [Polyangiaceae bacterium]